METVWDNAIAWIAGILGFVAFIWLMNRTGMT
jgi:hypothetical protein